MSQQNPNKPPNHSPPRTPPSAASKYNPAKRGCQPRPSVRETFLDDVTPADNTTSSNDSGDERDPHDLSLSPKHAARTSIVDNMLLSLDQFASGTSVLDDYRLFNSVFESDTYGRSSQDSVAQPRYRGHTFSSSLSSEAEYAYNESVGRGATQSGRGRGSTSSSNCHSSLRRFESARGRDGTGSRGQVYDHRVNSGGAPSAGRTTGRQSSKESSSPMDSGPALVRHPAESTTETRSASFDYGFRSPFVPFAEAHDGHDGMDAAPTPSVPAGPRKYQSPSQGEHTGTLNYQSSRTPVASRRNSVQSARTNQSRSVRPEHIGTATARGRENELANFGESGLDAPPTIPASHDPPAPSPTISFNKPMSPLPDPAPTKERPGFFRRVFGSSKVSTPGPPDSSQLAFQLPQENDSKEPNALGTNSKMRRQPLKNTATAAITGREGMSQVVNKKSSFFRRRKKSIVETTPPPVLPTQELNTKTAECSVPVSSPVSSLRKIMDSYIADAGGQTSGNTIESPKTIDGAEDSLAKKPGNLLSPKWDNSKPRYSLYPATSSNSTPNAATLGPSSGNETVASHSGCSDNGHFADRMQEQLPARENVEPHNSGQERSEADRIRDSLQNTLCPPENTAPSSLSPVVENFSQKSVSPTEALDDTHSLDTNELAEVKDQSGPTQHDDKPEEASELSSSVVRKQESPAASTSEISNYCTASNTPVVPTADQKTTDIAEDQTDLTDDVVGMPAASDKEQAQKLYDSQDQMVGCESVGAWLGGPERSAIRNAYMELFDWSSMNILAALRSLCNRLVLKGETQQVDRVLDAFSARWCQCNPNHGFKATDVVHTICYSLLLLNTDLHLADIEQKMTKNQFVRNTMPTIHRVAVDAAPDEFEALAPGNKSKTPVADSSRPQHDEGEKSTNPPAKLMNRLSRTDLSVKLAGDPDSDTGPLVNLPFYGSMRAWEQQVETVLRDFYSSIQKQRLPLHGAQVEKEGPRSSSTNLLSPNPGGLRRSPSTVSKSGSDIYPRGRSADSRYGTARWSSKPRSRVRLYPPSTMGSSRTSLEDQSSLWSPSASSTWSKYSLGKLTSASVDSFGSEYMRGDYQQSIGFANALSQAIIREDYAHSITSVEDPGRTMALLEDETLQLAGAPWAKEGSLKHKHHLDSVDKRAKDRNWNECFAVIQQGWMRLFSFNSSAKSVKQKAKQRQPGGVVVGGGNWTENAEEIWKFLLRQTIASALPPPGYSKSRPHVWALSLPTGAVHLFQVGTPEIVREFVSSANYWSARLSKEPLIGGISNIEYGWSDALINSALITPESARTPPSSSGARPSIQSSIRSSIDQQGGIRPKLPADRVHISDWAPPQQSMTASTLAEADQLSALRSYVKSVEEELQRHNELRPAMVLAFSPRHPNASKAMANWERKSSYLLREIVKFRTYIDSLQGGIDLKNKIYASREGEESTPS
ncbi:hypothetical protein EYZ11_005062 [Aspergillus tanneri]|uniref:SEC7 domain-containing protein n=1 Tax=Aspergillus tanneri TaxID=1220188 RepID=A0A4S3JLB7_9EURO|nr:uncharacterized protein ATNIH1004_006917 [Aspergillus tanneri]KAA8645498.1 hypothetical protein ATNIH1004_006917 [Aspergillus tanneri]THC95468.1 hypothetical protein EYZ11_005062 [Aspergillus tanneri]